MRKSLLWSWSTIAAATTLAPPKTINKTVQQPQAPQSPRALPSKLQLSFLPPSSSDGDLSAPIADSARAIVRAESLVYVRGPAVIGDPTRRAGVRVVSISAVGTGGDSDVVLTTFSGDNLVEVAVPAGESWAVEPSGFVACVGAVELLPEPDEDGRLVLSGVASQSSAAGRAWLRVSNACRVVVGGSDGHRRLQVGEAGAVVAVGEEGRVAYLTVGRRVPSSVNDDDDSADDDHMGIVDAEPVVTMTGPAMTEPAMTGPAMTVPAMTGPAMTGPAMTGPAMSRAAIAPSKRSNKHRRKLGHA